MQTEMHVNFMCGQNGGMLATNNNMHNIYNIAPISRPPHTHGYILYEYALLISKYFFLCHATYRVSY